jgi:hypothetical protein
MDCSRDSRFGHEEEYAMRSRRRRGLGVQLGFRRCELGPGDAIAFDSPTAPPVERRDDPVRGIWFVVGPDG